MRFCDLLKLLKKRETIDVLCEALIGFIKGTASQIRTLENLYRETFDGHSELEEKMQELQKQQEILSGLLKHTTGFFRDSLFLKDFKLMRMSVPDYIPDLKALEEDEREEEKDDTGADIIYFDSIRNRR